MNAHAKPQAGMSCHRRGNLAGAFSRCRHVPEEEKSHPVAGGSRNHPFLSFGGRERYGSRHKLRQLRKVTCLMRQGGYAKRYEIDKENVSDLSLDLIEFAVHALPLKIALSFAISTDVRPDFVITVSKWSISQSLIGKPTLSSLPLRVRAELQSTFPEGSKTTKQGSRTIPIDRLSRSATPESE